MASGRALLADIEQLPLAPGWLKGRQPTVSMARLGIERGDFISNDKRMQEFFHEYMTTIAIRRFFVATLKKKT
jgi:hypothetical protein